MTMVSLVGDVLRFFWSKDHYTLSSFLILIIDIYYSLKMIPFSKKLRKTIRKH